MTVDINQVGVVVRPMLDGQGGPAAPSSDDGAKLVDAGSIDQEASAAP
jgi:hypothetical protein